VRVETLVSPLTPGAARADGLPPSQPGPADPTRLSAPVQGPDLKSKPVELRRSHARMPVPRNTRRKRFLVLEIKE